MRKHFWRTHLSGEEGDSCGRSLGENEEQSSFPGGGFHTDVLLGDEGDWRQVSLGKGEGGMALLTPHASRGL